MLGVICSLQDLVFWGFKVRVQGLAVWGLRIQSFAVLSLGVLDLGFWWSVD